MPFASVILGGKYSAESNAVKGVFKNILFNPLLLEEYFPPQGQCLPYSENGAKQDIVRGIVDFFVIKAQQVKFMDVPKIKKI